MLEQILLRLKKRQILFMLVALYARVNSHKFKLRFSRIAYVQNEKQNQPLKDKKTASCYKLKKNKTPL